MNNVRFGFLGEVFPFHFPLQERRALGTSGNCVVNIV